MSRVTAGGPACKSRTIREDDLHAAVVTAVNDIWRDRGSVAQSLMDVTQAVVDSDTDSRLSELDARIKDKQQELLDAGRDEAKVETIGNEIIRLREERQEVLSDAARQKGIQERMTELSNFLDAQTKAITEYSEALVRRLIDTITVYDKKLVVVFKSGITTEVEI